MHSTSAARLTIQAHIELPGGPQCINCFVQVKRIVKHEAVRSWPFATTSMMLFPATSVCRPRMCGNCSEDTKCSSGEQYHNIGHHNNDACTSMSAHTKIALYA